MAEGKSKLEDINPSSFSSGPKLNLLNLNNKCFFCLKDTAPITLGDGETENSPRDSGSPRHRIFPLRNISRYLGFNGNERILTQQGIFGICEDCFPLTEEFQGIYAALDVLQIRMNWCLRKVCGVMERAKGDEEDEFMSLRRMAIRSGYKKIAETSFPLVSLNRMRLSNDESKSGEDETLPSFSQGETSKTSPTCRNDNHVNEKEVESISWQSPQTREKETPPQVLYPSKDFKAIENVELEVAYDVSLPRILHSPQKKIVTSEQTLHSSVKFDLPSPPASEKTISTLRSFLNGKASITNQSLPALNCHSSTPLSLDNYIPAGNGVQKPHMENCFPGTWNPALVSLEQFKDNVKHMLFTDLIMENFNGCWLCGEMFPGCSLSQKSAHLIDHFVMKHPDFLVEKLKVIQKDPQFYERLSAYGANAIPGEASIATGPGSHFELMEMKHTKLTEDKLTFSEELSCSGVESSYNSPYVSQGSKQVQTHSNIAFSDARSAENYSHQHKITYSSSPYNSVEGTENLKMVQKENVTPNVCPYCKIKLALSNGYRGNILTLHMIRYHMEHFFPSERNQGLVTDTQYRMILGELLFKDFVRRFDTECRLCRRTFGSASTPSSISQRVVNLKEHFLRDHYDILKEELNLIQRDPNLAKRLSSSCGENAVICSCCGAYLRNLKSQVVHQKSSQCNNTITKRKKETEIKTDFSLKRLRFSVPEEDEISFQPLGVHFLLGEREDDPLTPSFGDMRFPDAEVNPSLEIHSKILPLDVLTGGLVASSQSENNMQAEIDARKPKTCPYCNMEIASINAAYAFKKHVLSSHMEHFFPNARNVALVSEGQFQKIVSDLLFTNFTERDNTRCRICGKTDFFGILEERSIYLKDHLLEDHYEALIERLESMQSDLNSAQRLSS